MSIRGDAPDEMDRLFTRGGEVGRILAGMNWAATSLGPVQSWSATLRTAVSICLESRLPVQLFWGPTLIEFHNDALIPMLGSRHAGYLGLPADEMYYPQRRQCQEWRQAHERHLSRLKKVMSNGDGDLSENMTAVIDRHGFIEEFYVTVAYNPIRQFPGGEVLGVMTVGQETTRNVLGTRRLSCLRELGLATPSIRPPPEIFARSVEVLRRCSADVLYCLIASGGPESEGPLRLVAAAGIDSAGGRHLPDISGPAGVVPELDDALTKNRVIVVEGIPERLALHPVPEASASRSAIVAPLTTGRGVPPLGLLIVGLSPRLPVDSDYRDFIRLAASQIATAAIVGHTAAKEREMAAEAQHRARHDTLTGLPNRTALFEELERLSSTGVRPAGERAAFLFVDLDGFKKVNDTLGHQAGDDLLRETAGLLCRAVRPGDVVARLGGDEFAVVCWNIASRGAAEAVAKRIISSLETLRAGRGPGIGVTASVGIAISGPGIFNADQLVRAADMAMYAAKRHGRGRWQHFEKSIFPN
jgi:diguanylate cyclase (GGDEF)-like protein